MGIGGVIFNFNIVCYVILWYVLCGREWLEVRREEGQEGGMVLDIFFWGGEC